MFVCVRSFEIFRSKSGKLLEDFFSSWTDLYTLTMCRFDPSCLKHVTKDESRLEDLFSEELDESFASSEPGSQVMKRLFSSFKSPERFLSYIRLPESLFLVLVIDVGLVRITSLNHDYSVLGSLALNGDGLEKKEWSCGVDLSCYTDRIQTQTASRLGLHRHDTDIDSFKVRITQTGYRHKQIQC